MKKEEPIQVNGKISFFPSPNFPSQLIAQPIITRSGNRKIVREVPVYGFDLVPVGYCSRYVRLSAKRMFEENFASEHGWNLRYANDSVAEVETSLIQLVQDGTLFPGMAVGIINPLSESIEEKDLTGNKAKYTHVALYIGNNLCGEPLLIEQFIDRVNVRTESSLEKDRLTPIEIIRAKK